MSTYNMHGTMSGTPASGSGGAYLLSVKSIGSSTLNGRKPSKLIDAARHNRRAIQAELGAHSHIDAKRICLNEPIAGPDTPEAVVALALKLKTDAGVGKLRKDHVQAIELLFSLAPNTRINVRDYFRRCLVWVGDHFGVSNVLSADIHQDESAPHCHILILPLKNGRMQGSNLISKPAVVSLHKTFAQEVAHEFGLKAPPARLTGAKHRLAVRKVMQQLESTRDPILTSPLWPIIKRDIERNPAPSFTALGIDMDEVEPERKKRTMAQIFTSPGKGCKVDKAVNPFWFSGGDVSNAKRHEISTKDTQPKHRTLPCVGFGQKITHSEATNPRRNAGCETVPPGALHGLLAETQPVNNTTLMSTTHGRDNGPAGGHGTYLRLITKPVGLFTGLLH